MSTFLLPTIYIVLTGSFSFLSSPESRGVSLCPDHAGFPRNQGCRFQSHVCATPGDRNATRNRSIECFERSGCKPGAIAESTRTVRRIENGRAKLSYLSKIDRRILKVASIPTKKHKCLQVERIKNCDVVCAWNETGIIAVDTSIMPEAPSLWNRFDDFKLVEIALSACSPCCVLME
jgi:hypothetical protein